MKRFLVGGCAALLLAGCSQDPSLYLGGPPGPATRVQLSSGNVALTVGRSATIGAAALDEVGNVTGDVPTFSACGGPISTASATPFGMFSAATTIDAAPSAVGETCVLASAGGLSDSIHVTVGPAGLTLTGPDTVVSGETASYTATGYDAAGAPVTGTVPLVWTTSNEALMITEFAAGNIAGRTPGTVSLRTRAANGVDATKSVVILIGTFSGTLSAANGSAGLQVTATSGAADDPFDANTAATYGGQAAFVELLGPTSFLVAVPATGVAGAQNLDLTNLGPNQTARRVSFTANSTFDDQYGAVTQAPGTAPSYAASRSPNGWVYFTHSGFGTGVPSRGLLNGGTQEDHYFLITTGAGGGLITEARLEWTNGGAAPSGGSASDVDVYICPTTWGGDFDLCAAQLFSPATTNEIGTNIALNANTTYFVAASMWTARTNIHNFRLRLRGTGFN
jgi:hypothetical protein